MTKVSFAAIAATYACVLMACGGTEDGRDYRVADAGTGTGAGDSGSITDAGLKKDASQIPPDEGSGGGGSGGQSGGSGSGSGTGSGGTATCDPGGSCGGLYYCDDSCYTERCCQLSCSCSDPTGQTGTLECSLTSCQN